jgi:hypothetical protein
MPPETLLQRASISQLTKHKQMTGHDFYLRLGNCATLTSSSGMSAALLKQCAVHCASCASVELSPAATTALPRTLQFLQHEKLNRRSFRGLLGVAVQEGKLHDSRSKTKKE